MMKFECIYVVCPGAFKTGGTELAHQLVYKLNNKGINAKIAYSSSKNGVFMHPAFAEYINDYVKLNDIPDNENTIIVFPETLTDLISNYSLATIYVWWMSVDNYYNRRNMSLEVKEYGFPKAILSFFKSKVFFKKYGRRKYLPLSNMTNVKMHLVQSDYAFDFLKKNGITNVKYLTDYINKEYTERYSAIDITKKENYVIYNPRKGKLFTNKIIKSCPNILFVPLQGMTNSQVIECMEKAKVYIDFGPHPGKDRMPREAAMMKCCIITGKRGSAAYEDVPIKEKYKFEDNPSNIKSIKKAIENVLENYDIVVQDFQQYCDWIAKEEERFDKEIDDIFGLYEQ